MVYVQGAHCPTAAVCKGSNAITKKKHGWIILKFGTHITIDGAPELIKFSRIWLKGHGHGLTQDGAFVHLVHFGQDCSGVETELNPILPNQKYNLWKKFADV